MGNETQTGTVKFFSSKKGYGFINDKKGDLFVHWSAIQKEGFKFLKKDDLVEYEVDVGDEGKRQAINVKILEKAKDRDTSGDE